MQAERSGSERYAEYFNTVEINSTHHKHQMEHTFQRWATSVPDDFHFTVKMHWDITHVQRLTQVGPIEAFLEEVRGLYRRLGPVPVELPPELAWMDAPGEELEAVCEKYHGPPS